MPLLARLVSKLGRDFKINLQVIQDENTDVNERGICKHRGPNRTF